MSDSGDIEYTIGRKLGLYMLPGALFRLSLLIAWLVYAPWWAWLATYAAGLIISIVALPMIARFISDIDMDIVDRMSTAIRRACPWYVWIAAVTQPVAMLWMLVHLPTGFRWAAGWRSDVLGAALTVDELQWLHDDALILIATGRRR